MTYGFLLLFAFVLTNSYHNWFVYVELYYLQLFTIIAYHLNAHIMLLRYVICNYVWHMGSPYYELLLLLFSWEMWHNKKHLENFLRNLEDFMSFVANVSKVCVKTGLRITTTSRKLNNYPGFSPSEHIRNGE